LRVGLLGTGAIANKHAQAYQNLGWTIAACSNRTAERGRAFATHWNTTFVENYEDLCSMPELDYVDICTFPNFHLEPLEICAANGVAVMVQKPIATDLETARAMVRIARQSGILFGVMSQHRFDDATIFLKRAFAQGRLGKLLQADAYVKWFRNDEYYSRPVKGSWETEGGGALINQAIHQVDLLLYLAGAVDSVGAIWQLGARHRIESEDVLNTLLSFRSGATGVLQASTAFWPGYPERMEFHGTKGTAVITGDQLTAWDVLDDPASDTDPAPVNTALASGASDPMAISVTSFERQFQDFAEALRDRREPLVNGDEGLRALEFVVGVYRSCRERRFVQLSD
jgi:UDP-N-acetyl-2-amino-2-deoxyglucuronate dehydrogenase